MAPKHDSQRIGLDALTLIKLLNSKGMSASDLTAHERRKIVLYFMQEQSDFSDTDISRVIGIRSTQVAHIKKEMLKKGMWELSSLDTGTVALQFVMKKREIQRKALQKENYDLAWKIEVDFVSTLQRMGFIFEAPQKVREDPSEKTKSLLDKLAGYFERNTDQTIEEFVVVTGLLPENGGGNGGGNGQGNGPYEHGSKSDVS